MDSLNKSIKLKKELDSLRPIKKEDELRIMQKFRLEWNFHSNNLEGNSLTYGETKALIFFGITAQGKPLRDHFEIVGHDEAIRWVMEIVNQERPFTENFIRELHTLIIKEPYEIDAITPEGKPTKKNIKVGTYKTTPNHVKSKTGEIFRFASPEETPALMHDLIIWYQEKLKDKNLNPILLASNFHYKFIRIHPFDDGNGRTARILMNFILMQFGFPPVIIKTEDKYNYFSALQQADSGIIEPLINYISENLNRSLELMIKGARGENIEEDEDLSKELALLEKQLYNIGSKIEVTKNKEVLLDLYDKSISPLAAKFFAKGELFEKFYIKSGFGMGIGSQYTNSSSQKIAISNYRGTIKDDEKWINFYYIFEGFNQEGFDTFQFNSQINILLDFTFYTVSDYQNSVSIQKPYGDQLKEEEMDIIIKSEIKRHKDIIEEKIEEVKKKNNSKNR